MLELDGGVRGLEITERGEAALERAKAGLAGFHAMFARLSPERRVTVLMGLNVAEAALRPPPSW